MAIRLPWLEPERPDWFPPTGAALAEPNGLLCAGGDLSSRRLRQAYAKGIFPWFSPGEPILWWSPEPRCVLPLTEVRPPRSLRSFCRRSDWTLTSDEDFSAVLRACAAPRSTQTGTWISREMRLAYEQLQREGVAHSLEVRRADGTLIGGLYGLALGRVFFGESMFSLESQASKVALFALARVLGGLGYTLLDGQVVSPHLQSLGFVGWPRDRFESQLPAGPHDVGHWPVRWPLSRVAELG